MSKYSISIRPFGVHALLVEWPNKVAENILDDILAFVNDLKNNRLNEKEWELVPSYNSLTLIQRTKPIDFDSLQINLQEWYDNMGKSKVVNKFLWRLPVCYDLDFGIDLQETARYLKKSIPEIIDLHTSSTYTLYGIGFLPGFMYLGGLAKILEIPRRTTPRLQVKKGAVGLAGKQTGIYPQESPGGWNIIGSCAVPIFNVMNNEPCFFNVGDKIQFYAISRSEYDLCKIEVEVGIYKFEKIEIDA